MITPAWLRELGYEYDPLRCTWFAKDAIVMNEDSPRYGQPARIPVPPFGITDLMLANQPDPTT